MNQITEHLYITSAETLLDLGSDHEFDEVVSLGSRDHLGLDETDPSTTGDQFVFPDGPHEYAIFEAAADYTLQALHAGQTVLVHCQAGVSRSAGVCAAAIATRDNCTAQQALETVSQSRPVVDPTAEIWASTVRYVSGDE